MVVGTSSRSRTSRLTNVVPRSQGGGHELENLQLLCNACNRRKGRKSQPAFLAEMKADYGAIWEGRR